jgi:hypothetical protein
MGEIKVLVVLNIFLCAPSYPTKYLINIPVYPISLTLPILLHCHNNIFTNLQ